MNIKAIETQYKGYRFRSRLEARWAVFFDSLGVRWEYEKEGFDLGKSGWYLPDFWLPDYQCWVEVKGEYSPDFSPTSPGGKAIALEQMTGNPVVIFTSIPDSTSDKFWNSHHSLMGFTRPLPLGVKGELTGEEDQDGWGLHIHCPVCQFEYVHFEPATFQSSDDYSAWGGRGGALRIPMWCENGHSWVLRFGAHKGYTYMAFEGISQDIENPGLIFANGDQKKFMSALVAARQARFEHGAQ